MMMMLITMGLIALAFVTGFMNATAIARQQREINELRRGTAAALQHVHNAIALVGGVAPMIEGQDDGQ